MESNFPWSSCRPARGYLNPITIRGSRAESWPQPRIGRSSPKRLCSQSPPVHAPENDGDRAQEYHIRRTVSARASLGLKLRRSMIVSRPVMARPNPRVGADKLIVVLPPRESAMSKNLDVYVVHRAALPRYSLTSHSLTETLSTSRAKIEWSLAFVISSTVTGGLV